MQLKYTSKDGVTKLYPIEYDGFDLAEIQDIESYSGMSLKRFWQAFDDGRFGLVRVLLYVLLKRENPQVRYADVRPKFPTEITIVQDREELEAVRERVLADPAWPDRDETLAAIEQQIAELSGEPGKDETPSPRTSTTSGNRASRRAGRRTA